MHFKKSNHRANVLISDGLVIVQMAGSFLNAGVSAAS